MRTTLWRYHLGGGLALADVYLPVPALRTAALAVLGLRPDRLTLEITKSVLAHVEVAVVRRQELKRLGVHLAIDDFGTGYSSLSYLQRMPIDAVKIDKSFVDGVTGGPEESAVARAILALAATLRLDTVAEGRGGRAGEGAGRPRLPLGAGLPLLAAGGLPHPA